MVKIRLRRVGAKKQPSYRVVVTDSRAPRDGRFIETIGHYNPRTDPPTVVIKEDRALYWLSVGAQPSDAVARFLEKLGYRAYPFPANMPHISKPSEEYPGGPGDISHKHVAVACGLGQIGWHNLLISPQFGTRQKLTTIITGAPLEPDPMCEDRLCDPLACGFQCARACPTAAIPGTLGAKTTIRMRDKPVQYAKIVGWRCRWGCSGMLKSAGGYTDVPMPDEEPTAEELLRCKAQLDPWQVRLKATSGGLLPYCGRCLCVCPAGRSRG